MQKKLETRERKGELTITSALFFSLFAVFFVIVVILLYSFLGRYFESRISSPVRCDLDYFGCIGKEAFPNGDIIVIIDQNLGDPVTLLSLRCGDDTAVAEQINHVLLHRNPRQYKIQCYEKGNRVLMGPKNLSLTATFRFKNNTLISEGYLHLLSR